MVTDKLCPSFAKSNTILNSKNDRKMGMERGGSCNASNIIYAAECRKHKKLYIDQSKNQINRRFCGHRSDIKKLISNTSDGDVGGTVGTFFVFPTCAKRLKSTNFR